MSGKLLTKADESKKKATEDENTGIGLVIAKSIADFHDIEINVKSEQGKETIFIFCWRVED